MSSSRVAKTARSTMINNASKIRYNIGFHLDQNPTFSTDVGCRSVSSGSSLTRVVSGSSLGREDSIRYSG